MSGFRKIAPILIYFAAFFLLLTGCRQEYTGTEIRFEPLSKDFYCSLEDERNVAVHDRDSLDDLLASAGLGLQQEIDFDRSAVIAVFMGQRPTGGYDIEIKRIVESNDKILVYFETTEPSEDEMTAQVITSPYHMVKIDLTEKEVVFEKI